MKVYQAIARALSAIENCTRYRDHAHDMEESLRYNDMINFWEDRIHAIESLFLPRGAGFDTGEKVDIEASNPDKVVINGEFHVMNEHGFYDGYAPYKIIITPSLSGEFDVKLVGSSKWPSRQAYYGLRGYIETIYNETLSRYIKWEDLQK